MKIISIMGLAFIFAAAVMQHDANALALLCNTNAKCGTSLNPCCCPTGETTTTYTCPTGWIYNISQKHCSRISTSGSDSTGYYTQTYGTCDGTPNTQACYEAVPRDKQNGRRCYCLADN